MNKKTENKAVSPWQWVPSLYFAQGIPYVVVMSVAVILFKRMGMSNTDIALYTSGLNLPWVIKPLWSPLVDLLKTKRWWIVVMQILVGAGLAGIALTIQGPWLSGIAWLSCGCWHSVRPPTILLPTDFIC